MPNLSHASLILFFKSPKHRKRSKTFQKKNCIVLEFPVFKNELERIYFKILKERDSDVGNALRQARILALREMGYK